MRVLAVTGSPRRAGNTSFLIDEVLARLQDAGMETEHVSLSGHLLAGCIGCGECGKTRDLRCALVDDGFNDLLAKTIEADGIVLGSPVCWGGMASAMKAFVERAGSVSAACGGVLHQKVGAAVVAVRRSGALSAFDSINHLFLTSGMIVVGSTYWNVGIGRYAGDVANDAEGLDTMRNLGDSMAHVLLCLRGREETGRAREDEQ